MYHTTRNRKQKRRGAVLVLVALAIVGLMAMVAFADMAGNTLEYHIVGWGVVTVVDSQWHGNSNTFLVVEKSYTYMGHLYPQPDLSNTTDTIQGAFTSPVLVE
jgi:hypothetical protein